MLIAPYSASPLLHGRSVPPTRSRAGATRPPNGTLSAWLVIGLLALLCVPAARGGRTFGATLPFWLVAAPLLDLIWIERRRMVHAVVHFVRDSVRSRRRTRSVRAQRVPRTACSAERSKSS